jgi:hypothetical protein
LIPFSSRLVFANPINLAVEPTSGKMNGGIGALPKFYSPMSLELSLPFGLGDGSNTERALAGLKTALRN